MSFVEGAKITDKETLLSWGLNLDEVDGGLRLYLTQVIDHGFFHADPHPRNLLVMQNGQTAFIDLGSIIAASLFVLANHGAKIFGIPLLAVFCLVISLICMMLFFYSLLQRKK